MADLLIMSWSMAPIMLRTRVFTLDKAISVVLDIASCHVSETRLGDILFTE